MLFSCGSAINIWDTASPAIPRTFTVEGGPVKSIDFNLKTNKAYFCTNSTKLFELDFEKGVVSEAETNMAEIQHVKMSSSGETILLSDKEKRVALYNIEKFPEIKRISTHKAHNSPITAIALSNRPGFFFAGDEKGKISIYDPDKGKPTLLPGWTSKNGSVKAMVYDSVFDNLIIATNLNIYIKYPYGKHQTEDRKLPDTLVFPLLHQNPTCICISPKLATVFGIGYENGVFQFVKKTDGTEVHSITEKGKIESIDIDENGEYVAIAASGDNNYLIQTTELKPTFTFPNVEPVILRLVPKLFTTTLGARMRKNQRLSKVEENHIITTTTTTTVIEKETEFSTQQANESARKFVPSSAKKTASSISVRTSTRKSSNPSNEPIPNETPKQPFLSRQRKIITKEPEQASIPSVTPKKEEPIQEEVLLLHPGSSTNLIKDEDDIPIPKPNIKTKDHPDLTINTKLEDSKESPSKATKKSTPKIEDTPPRVKASPFSSATSSLTHLSTAKSKETKQKPLQKVIISDDSDDSSYSTISDIPEGPIDNKELLKHLKSFVNDKFDNLGQQINTVYLDILCRMRGLEERIASIEKTIGTSKK